MARRRDIPKDDMLDAAERFLTRLGYNGFSIRDLSEEVGISGASLHHHFPAKADLGVAIVERYRDRLNRRLADIEAAADDWPGRWNRIVDWFLRFCCDENKVCVLGSLAHDFHTLPPSMQGAAKLLHGNLHGWLTRFVAAAIRNGQLQTTLAADDEAAALLAKLQGAMVLSRTSSLPTDETSLNWLKLKAVQP